VVRVMIASTVPELIRAPNSSSVSSTATAGDTVTHQERRHGRFGERNIVRLLSASITCRLQSPSLFAYLSELLAAHARGHPVPLLS
jgi:hypothetical protein